MNIVWSSEAIDDLILLRAYIAEDNATAARGVALHILHNIEQVLPNNPQMGRPGRIPGTHSFKIKASQGSGEYFCMQLNRVRRRGKSKCGLMIR